MNRIETPMGLNNATQLFSWSSYPGMLKAWIVYLGMFPIYYFPSGSPQFADIFMALLLPIGYYTGSFKLTDSFSRVNGIFLAFLGYVTVANFSVFVANFGLETKGLPWFVITMFYGYNYFVFRLAIGLYVRYRHQFIKATLLGVIASVVIAVGLGQFFTEFNDIRGSLTFKTSNQLGYFSLICTTIILLLQKVVDLPRWTVLMLMLSCLYMAAVSISNAALLSITILFGIYFFESGLFSLRRLLGILSTVVIGVVLMLTTSFGQTTIERYQYRLDTSVREEAGVSEFEYRGYDRIFNHPGYLILGAGEGAYNRFDTYIDNHEMHSSIGTIIFCYGIPGTVLFGLLIVSLLSGLKVAVIVYSLPIFAYGVTHMGLRFTVFWIALALFPILRNYSQSYFSVPRSSNNA
ncbi:hypothetical protein GGR28_002854 [Lewinella aquimaris]|uniref:O-antigen ligase n=1 Tax=Neolewinella aquimaris TaxID=1835722 RepID=A0A840E3R2_9BACT|nr:hypothetical protein [Neolewinella aquimaris]MBB4080224.1 hypothetical protein [Neolewinella aquimaris]